MNALSHLITKPWLSTGPGNPEGGTKLPSAKFGLRVFLCVASALFLITVSAYFERMGYGDWRPLPEPWLLWLNTGVLILSSVALQGARISATATKTQPAKIALFVSGILASAFLGGQVLAWYQLNAAGYFLTTNPANTFFYLVTAFHGIHLLGGMVALAKTTTKLWRGADIVELRLSIELCAVYWHFLLVIWLVLFGLILMT